jgi:hypothetical protein
MVARYFSVHSDLFGPEGGTHQPFVDALMHEEPPQRRAPLTRRAHGRERNGAHSQIEISRGRDNGALLLLECR